MIKNCTNYFSCTSGCAESNENSKNNSTATKVDKIFIGRRLLIAATAVAIASIACAIIITPWVLLGLVPALAIAIFARCLAAEEIESFSFGSFIPCFAEEPFVPGQPVGIKNRKDDCWLNAGLQLLAKAPECHPRLNTIPKFKQFLVDYQLAGQNSQKVSRIDSHALRQFLFEQNCGVSSGDVQEDAILLFDFLFGEGKNAPYKLKHYYAGNLTNDICGPMIALHIPRKGIMPSFKELTTHFFDYVDNEEKSHQVRFEKMPPGVLIQAKRFYQDKAIQEKIYHPVEFPLALSIPAPLVDDNPNQENKTYACDAFIVHNGSLRGGHYVAYIKENDVWWRCSDRTVRKAQDIEKEIQHAYILHYAKVDG